jgi:hypothetical protein
MMELCESEMNWLKRFVRRVLSPGTTPSQNASKMQEFSIGICVGDSPLRLCFSENIDNPVLTRTDVSDVRAAFVADPFMLKADHTWYMFFEVWNRQTRKGEIGLATSSDATKWTYQQIVLSEPFHLSYPYVFEWMGDYYMVPESYQAGSIRLYKAVRFPANWSFLHTVARGPYYADASIFRHHNKWWIFTETNPNMRNDTLRLFFADDLMGLWQEHPKSPLIEGNGHIARPAGRVLAHDEMIIRYAQDCDPVYGNQVRAFEITELTTTSYREQEVKDNPVLTGSGSGWNESGMHHIDPHLEEGRWIACVDGWCWK